MSRDGARVLSPVLRALKAGTADLHAEAERYVRILDDDAGVAEYVRYLVAMIGFHAPVEGALARHAALDALGFDAPARCVKAAWMRADLRALRHADEPEVCTVPPGMATLPAALGCAYVLEGATLGGRFILAKLPPPLAALRGTATRYLEGYGERTGARWRAFTELVSRSDSEMTELVDGARDTFSRLIAWLARFEARRGVLREAS